MFIVCGPGFESRTAYEKELAKKVSVFTPPDVRVHAAAPMLGYTRLPRFRVRHSQPRLFRAAFGREGWVVGIRLSLYFVCVLCVGHATDRPGAESL